MARKRGAVKRELKELLQYPPKNIRVTTNDDNVKNWIVYISGPSDSPYKYGEFELDVDLSTGYPIRCPKLKIKTPIFHMNINKVGTICLRVVDDWEEKNYTMMDVFDNIQELLSSPNLDSALRPELVVLYKNDINKYNETAKEWTKKFAAPLIDESKEEDDDDDDDDNEDDNEDNNNNNNNSENKNDENIQNNQNQKQNDINNTNNSNNNANNANNGDTNANTNANNNNDNVAATNGDSATKGNAAANGD